jgi:hypothetical protein
VRLLLDEPVSGKVADRLRRLGHDAIAAAAEPSLRGLPDADLFEFARLAAALASLLEQPDPGGSFLIWLQSAD